MNWLLNIFLLGVIVYAAFNRWGKDLKWLFWSGLTLKVVGAVALGLIYSFYYNSGDTWTFVEVADLLRKQFNADPSDYLATLFGKTHELEAYFPDQPRAIYFVKLISPVVILAGGNYWIVSLYFAVVAFLSSWFLFRELHNRLGGKWIWFITLFSYPSLVFWCSGVLKDTLIWSLLAILTGYCFYLERTYYRFNWKLIAVLISAWFLFKIKYYVAASFLPLWFTLIVINWLTLKYSAFRMKWLKFSAAVVCLLCLFLVATQTHPNFSSDRFAKRIVTSYDLFQSKTIGEFKIEYNELNPSVESMLANAPKAIMSGLFRPLPWEGTSFFQLLAGLEHLFIMGLTLLGIFCFFRLGLPTSLMGLLVVVYLLLMGMFIGLSTPNFGTLVRFQTAYLPFLMMIDSYLVYRYWTTSVHPQK